MTNCLKRALFFFCCFYFGLSSCPNTQAAAQDWFSIHIPSIRSGHSTVKREISGYVLYNGGGLGDVGIYEGNQLLAVTNAQGYYKALLNLGFSYTLAPEKPGYAFTPAERIIPGDEFNHENQNFTAQKLPTVSISGQVIWKNSGIVTIPFNPLPQVAIEAYSQDGSLYSRVVTGTDGKYSFPVPIGWYGRVRPYRLGFFFYLEEYPIYNLKEDTTRDFEAPFYDGNPGQVHTITVKVQLMGGAPPPPDKNIGLKLEGIEHATGSQYYEYIIKGTGECSFTKSSGWIGVISPENGANTNYSYTPAFIRMSGPLSDNMSYIFTATPK